MITDSSSTTRSSSLALDEAPGLSVRVRERLLLVLAGGFIVANQVTFNLARGHDLVNLWHIVVWLICAMVAHSALERRIPNRDPYILPIVLLFAGWGLTLIDRLAPPFATRQTIWLALSTAALIGVTLLPLNLRWLRRYRYLWLIGGLLLLAATIVLGQNPAGYGPRLWLGFLNAYFQPSELLKVLLIVFLASYLAENREPLTTDSTPRLSRVRYLAPLLVMWGISAVVLVWQRDLGTATLFFVIFLGMLYVATGRLSYVVGGMIMLAIVGVAAYFAFDVVRLRVDVWFNPWPEADNRAFQIVQSLLAFASGGILGQGIGQGSPTYIPVVHSDFVFAAIAEEYGLVGALLVVLLTAALTVRSLRLAVRLEARPFHALLAAGIGITYATQSLLIMAGTLKMVPLTGVTLPFLSYGGSSLLINFVMIGLLLVLSNESP